MSIAKTICSENPLCSANCANEGHTFFCAQYAQVFVSAAASLGWVDRELALRRHQDPPAGGSTEHSTTEIWSNQHRKWVMMDPTANMHIPINQATVSLFPEQDKMRVVLRSMTPNFKAYEARMTSGAWHAVEETFLWDIRPGLNRLEVRTVNQFGVEGPISSVEIEQ